MARSSHRALIGEDPAAAAETIKNGGLVAIPTETFYGLAADPANEIAVSRIFKVKGRAQDQPVLLLVNQGIDINRFAAEVPQAAKTLMMHNWPGPLTIVFKATDKVSPILTGGTGLALGALGALVGGLVGRKRRDSRFPTEHVNQLAAALEPGSSAALIVMEPAWAAALEERLGLMGAEAMTADVPAAITEQSAADQEAAYAALVNQLQRPD